MSLRGAAAFPPPPELDGEEAVARMKQELDHCLANGFTMKSDGRLELQEDANVGCLLPIPESIIALTEQMRTRQYLEKQNKRFDFYYHPMVARGEPPDRAAELTRSIVSADIAMALENKKANTGKQRPRMVIPSQHPVPTTILPVPQTAPKPLRPRKIPEHHHQSPALQPPTYTLASHAVSSPTATNSQPQFHLHVPTAGGTQLATSMLVQAALQRERRLARTNAPSVLGKRYRDEDEDLIMLTDSSTVLIYFQILTLPQSPCPTVAPYITSYYKSPARMATHLLKLYRFRLKDRGSPYRFRISPLGGVSRVLSCVDEIPNPAVTPLEFTVMGPLEVTGVTPIRRGLADRFFTEVWVDRFEEYHDIVRDILEGVAQAPIWLTADKATKALENIQEIKEKRQPLFIALTEFLYATTHPYSHYRLMTEGYLSDEITEDARSSTMTEIIRGRVAQHRAISESVGRGGPQGPRHQRLPQGPRTGPPLPAGPWNSRTAVSGIPTPQFDVPMPDYGDDRPGTPVLPSLDPPEVVDPEVAAVASFKRQHWRSRYSAIRAEMRLINSTRMTKVSTTTPVETFSPRYQEHEFQCTSGKPFAEMLSCAFDPTSIPDLSRKMTYRASISGLEELAVVCMKLDYPVKIFHLNYRGLGSQRNPVEEILDIPPRNPGGEWFCNLLSHGMAIHLPEPLINFAIWKAIRKANDRSDRDGEEHHFRRQILAASEEVRSDRGPRLHAECGNFFRLEAELCYTIVSPFTRQIPGRELKILLNKTTSQPFRLQIAELRMDDDPYDPIRVTPVSSILTFFSNVHNFQPEEQWDTIKNRWTKDTEPITGEQREWISQTAREINEAKVVYQSSMPWPTVNKSSELPVYSTRP